MASPASLLVVQPPLPFEALMTDDMMTGKSAKHMAPSTMWEILIRSAFESAIRSLEDDLSEKVFSTIWDFAPFAVLKAVNALSWGWVIIETLIKQ